MSDVRDYVNRTVDMAALRGSYPSHGEQQLTQELVVPGDGGELISGALKLSQRLSLVLLKDKGSMLYDQNSGTTLLLDARRGLWRSVGDVYQSFAVAQRDALQQLQLIETSADQDDERILGIDLESVTLTQDQVKLFILVTTRAGQPVPVLVPLTIPLKR